MHGYVSADTLYEQNAKKEKNLHEVQHRVFSLECNVKALEALVAFVLRCGHVFLFNFMFFFILIFVS